MFFQLPNLHQMRAGGKYLYSNEASQTIRKSLVILLRNLRPEEEKDAQDQSNADVEPGID